MAAALLGGPGLPIRQLQDQVGFSGQYQIAGIYPLPRGSVNDLDYPGVSGAFGIIGGTVAEILIVDDEIFFLNLVNLLLRAQNHNTSAFLDANAALEHVREVPGRYEIAVLDLHMPQMDGISTLRTLQAIKHSVRFLLMSGSGVPADAVLASASGLVAFLPKPFEPEVFLSHVAELLFRNADEATARADGEVSPEHPERCITQLT